MVKWSLINDRCYMCHDLKIDDHNIFNFVIQMDNEELFLDDLLTQNDEEIKRLKDKLSRALKVERLLVSLNSVRLEDITLESLKMVIMICFND